MNLASCDVPHQQDQTVPYKSKSLKCDIIWFLNVCTRMLKVGTRGTLSKCLVGFVDMNPFVYMLYFTFKIKGKSPLILFCLKLMHSEINE